MAVINTYRPLPPVWGGVRYRLFLPPGVGMGSGPAQLGRVHTHLQALLGLVLELDHTVDQGE